MQTLGIVARLFPEILAGKKTATIRWREGPIVPDLLLYVCGGNPDLTAMVLVTKVTTMPLCEAARYLGREADWPDAVMLKGMREHYPDIVLDDLVEIIEHLTPEQTAELRA